VGKPIGNISDREKRTELRERIAALIRHHAELLTQPETEDSAPTETDARFEEELKSFYYALTGSYPTHDELGELLPK
jgi:acyl-CoA reductase-like NAD-dependent aldehyde dehydrogenase